MLGANPKELVESPPAGMAERRFEEARAGRRLTRRDNQRESDFDFTKAILRSYCMYSHRDSARSLSSSIRKRDLSCREVVTECLDRVERLNPIFNAIVSLRDRDHILAEADKKDEQLKRGESHGWLHGIPIAIKDLAATKGIRTTHGSPIYRDFIPRADAGYVARLRYAGAIVIGKTNTAEFGLGSHTYNSVFGATRNTFDPSRTAGGSSGGAAVAVATAMLPIADGSDNAGSLRNPAAFNHIYAFRPSETLARAEGRFACMPTLSVYGPLARNVGDLCAMLITLVGGDASTPASPLWPINDCLGRLDRDFAGARIGWLADLGGYLATDQDVLTLCETALKRLESAGCTIEHATIDFPMDALWSGYCDLRSWFVGSSLSKHYLDPTKQGLLKADAIWEIERGLALSAVQIFRALELRAKWVAALAELFKRFDFLALPSTQCLPFAIEHDWPREVGGRRMDTYHRWMEVAIPATMGACPVASVPAGFSRGGLPTGIQLIGTQQNDFACLQLARAYERIISFDNAMNMQLCGRERLL